MSSNPIKISEVPTVTTLMGTDTILVTANATGLPVTSQITLNNLIGNSNNAVFNLPVRAAPANSTSNTTIVMGDAFLAGNNFYVAVSNGVTLRVALSSF